MTRETISRVCVEFKGNKSRKLIDFIKDKFKENFKFRAVNKNSFVFDVNYEIGELEVKEFKKLCSLISIQLFEEQDEGSFYWKK